MAAPPAMSYFIFSMPSAGLMEMPPVSKVTPLPTSPRCALPRRRWRAGSAARSAPAARRCPCATPSSEPMPSFSIASRSSTSHSSPNSAAIFARRSAIASGVSRLAGSFTRSRVKFCASATIRPRSTAASRPGVVAGHRERIDRFLVVAGLVAVRLEIAQNRALHRGRREFVAGELGVQGECDPSSPIWPSGSARRRPLSRRISAASNFSGLPGARQQDPRRAHSRRVVEQRLLQRLSRRSLRSQKGPPRRNGFPSGLRRPERSGRRLPPVRAGLRSTVICITYRLCHEQTVWTHRRKIFQILELLESDPSFAAHQAYVVVFTSRQCVSCGKLNVRCLGAEFPKAVTT